ncbi:MAG: alkaline phosphatase family protein [Erysipelotrichaceae bacterium]|nr:alkaline phosphatase family protein [Erysipelotrichaceae bacterium]
MKITMPDYQTGLLNLMSSIATHYGCESDYPTHPLVDEELKQPFDNLFVILIDGMGSRLIERMLPETSFLRQHLKAEMTSVYPCTTAAATIVVESGDAPRKTAWTGWFQYFQEIQDHRVLFLNQSYYTREYHSGNFVYDTMGYRTMIDKLQEQGVSAEFIYPSFRIGGCKTFDEMCDRIVERSKGKNQFFYCYWDKLDSLMHDEGVDSEHVVALLKELDQQLAQLCSRLDDKQKVFIIADHGQVNTETINLLNYPDLVDCFRVWPAVETRAIAFFIKEEKKEIFESLFHQYFDPYFLLYPTEEFIAKAMVGPGPQHPRLQEFLGDYVACATDRYNLLMGEGPFIGQHAGLTEDEMMIPFIVYQK